MLFFAVFCLFHLRFLKDLIAEAKLDDFFQNGDLRGAGLAAQQLLKSAERTELSKALGQRTLDVEVPKTSQNCLYGPYCMGIFYVLNVYIVKGTHLEHIFEKIFSKKVHDESG